MSEQIPSGRIPSGWYSDKSVGAPAGQQRYWDGSAWTLHTTAPTTAPTVAESARKPGMFTRWGIPALVGVLAFLFGVGIGVASGNTGEPTTAASDTSGEPTPAPTVTVDPSAARQAELDQLAADLDEIAAEQAKVSEELAGRRPDSQPASRRWGQPSRSRPSSRSLRPPRPSQRMSATHRTNHAYPSRATWTAKAAAETARPIPEEFRSLDQMSTTWIATATASPASSHYTNIDWVRLGETSSDARACAVCVLVQRWTATRNWSSVQVVGSHRQRDLRRLDGDLRRCCPPGHSGVGHRRPLSLLVSR